MSRVGAAFEDENGNPLGLKEESERRRANSRRDSAAMLRGKGVEFVSRNKGAHLVIEDRVDFWPGTGLWIVRADQHRGRGVKALCKWLKRNKRDQA